MEHEQYNETSTLVLAQPLGRLTAMPAKEQPVGLYDQNYGRFATELYARIRAEAFGEDLGQTSWVTRDELELFFSWLGLGPGRRLLDVCCGSGGLALHAARTTACTVTGVDLHESAVAAARAQASSAGLGDRASFERADASAKLPFPDGSFDAVLCVDAINHLPDRPAVLAEWRRLLAGGGRLVFTDPIVVTGPLTNEEIAIRSSIGFFLFVPAGLDARMLASAGFALVHEQDRTENMARVALAWRAARERRAEDLQRVEGIETFQGQQRFLEVTCRLAAERRLSRLAFCASTASRG